MSTVEDDMEKPTMTVGRDMDNPKLIVALMPDGSFIKMTVQQAEILAAGILDVAKDIREEQSNACDA